LKKTTGGKRDEKRNKTDAPWVGPKKNSPWRREGNYGKKDIFKRGHHQGKNGVGFLSAIEGNLKNNTLDLEATKNFWGKKKKVPKVKRGGGTKTGPKGKIRGQGGSIGKHDPME